MTDLLTWQLLLTVLPIFLLGGLVKGVLGIGLPLVSVPLLSFFLPVPTAIALLAIPILLSNTWQMFQGENLAASARRFLPLLASLVVGILIGARLLVNLNAEVLYPALGTTLILVSAANLYKLKMAVPAKWEPRLSPMVGAAAGLLGGLSSFFGPVIVLYMVALKIPKETFISAIALAYLTGTVPLNLSLAYYDILTWQVALLSTAAMLPVGLGMLLGRWVRRFLPQETFRKCLLATLMLIGLELIRRVAMV